MKTHSITGTIVIISLFMLLGFNSAYTQSNLIMQPLSWDYDIDTGDSLVINTPDATELDKKYNKSYYERFKYDSIAAKYYPYFVAIDHIIDVSKEKGHSFITPKNEYVWICRIKFPTLKETQLLSDNFYIPENARLFIYSPTKEFLGAFDSKDNNLSKFFNTGTISANDFILEYNELLSTSGVVKGKFGFNRASVFLSNAEAGQSLSCEKNVNCNPWHDELCVQIRSVVKLWFHVTCERGIRSGEDGYVSCSGDLMNNSNYDLRPLILSARHCVQDYNDDDDNHWVFDKPETWVVYYNFQSPICDPTTMGNDKMQTVGMNILGDQVCSDLLTLEVTDNPGLFPRIPIQYNYAMNGWHLLGLDNGTTIYGIHHPKGDLKKVSEGTKVTSVVPCHWEVNISTGTLEHGSSGSPLIDAGHFTIGALSFGYHNYDDCNNNLFYYGALKDANRDVLKPFDNDDENIFAIYPKDPIADCLDHIDIYKILYPGGSWLAAQNQITIQASQTISVSPGIDDAIIADWPSVSGLGNAQTSPYTSSDYVFKAGQSITFYPGFRINVPSDSKGTTNILSAQIGACSPFVGCGFNYAKKDIAMTHIDSVLNSDSVIAMPVKNGGSKYYLKRKLIEKNEQIKSNEFVIKPNPATNELTIEFSSETEETIQILMYNAGGKKVKSGYHQIHDGINSIQLAISDLPAGIYVCRIITKSKSIQKKVIIQ